MLTNWLKNRQKHNCQELAKFDYSQEIISTIDNFLILFWELYSKFNLNYLNDFQKLAAFDFGWRIFNRTHTKLSTE